MPIGRVVWIGEARRQSVQWAPDQRCTSSRLMSFDVWCALYLDGVLMRLEAFEAASTRRTWVAEWEAEKARLWAALEAEVGKNTWRDIRDNVVIE